MWKTLFKTPDSFKVYHTNANGHCFFESLSIPLNKSILDLRKIVAYSLAKPNYTTNEIINTWRELEHSGLECARHMKCVHHIPLNKSLTRQNKVLVMKEMLTSKYWGDEYAIRVLQETFNIGICVIDDVAGVLRKPLEIQNPKYIVILLYTGNHYDLVLYDNKSIFTLREFLGMF